MEANNVAATLNGLRREKRMRRWRSTRARRGQDRCVVILEDRSVLVLLVLLAACTGVPRAQVALGVVLWQVGLLRGFGLTKPWTLGAVRRDEYVLSGERVNLG